MPFLQQEDPVTSILVFAMVISILVFAVGRAPPRDFSSIPKIYTESRFCYIEASLQIARTPRSARAVRDPAAGASPVPFAGTTRRSRRGFVLHCTIGLQFRVGCCQVAI
jgi:hypothetical protein